MDFDDFFTKEGSELLRLCFLVTLDQDAAADVVQETLTRAWTDWARLSQDGSDPAAWARTVALNICRSRWRRIWTARRHLSTLRSTSEPQFDRLPDVDLEGALRSLSTRQREAIVLRYWADLDIASCATAMQISPGAVKQHLARAHLHLANQLRDGRTSAEKQGAAT